MLESKLVDKTCDVIGLGPDAGHNDVARRAVESATPRAVIVVVNSVVGNGVNLGMLGGKLLVEGVNGWVRLDSADVALAQADVKLACLAVGETLVWEPDSEITAHRSSLLGVR